VEESAAIAKAEDEELFAFTCTSDYHALTNSLKLPKCKSGACMNMVPVTITAWNETDFRITDLWRTAILQLRTDGLSRQLA
jgi:hypothetical protein